MSEEIQSSDAVVAEPTVAAPATPYTATTDIVTTPSKGAASSKPLRGSNFRGNTRGGQSGKGGKGGGRPRTGGEQQVESDYEEKNLEVARVTRVTKGGKRMRFRVLTVIGNRKGRVGYGLAKGIDVALATSKATAQARKALFTVPMVNDTIPHPVDAKFGAAKLLIKPAPKGTGIKAGGAVRIVLELAGVSNVVSKMLGSGSKLNNVKATFEALRKLKIPNATKQDVVAYVKSETK